MTTVELPAGAWLRPIELGDDRALREVSLRNLSSRFRRSSPEQPESYWTPEGQRERVATAVRRSAAGEAWVGVIARGPAILGMVSLVSIVRGPFCNAALGYWIDEPEEGRGLISAAVAAVCTYAAAPDGLDLHRIEASTRPDNGRSQRVLTKNGFELIGRAPNYLYLDGAWQEAVLYQRILHGRPPRPGSA